MAAALLLGANETDAFVHEEDFEPLHKPEHEHEFFHFDETGAPLSILGCILLIGFLKAAFMYCKRLPHSVLLLLFGIAAGAILTRVFDDEIYLRPQWFFYYMLPPIVLEAGYYLKNKDFFQNIGTITLFAVVGTMMNIALMAGTLYMLRGWFNIPLSFMEISIFSVLICAVDPVAVLCVFEDIHVNELLYICVFGESLLNDAVTIVLYNTIISLVPAEASSVAMDIQMGPYDYFNAIVYFFKVSFGGIGCGIVGGFTTVIFMRLLVNYQIVQPINLILCPILFYLLTESMHLSAILAVVVTGILIKNYMQGNVNDPMRFTVEYLLKIGCSYAESLVFVFLGVSVISSGHEIDVLFIIVTLLGCFVYRFIVVYFLSFVANCFRLPEDKISFEDQFVIAYGGIRGAVCYGLVMAIDQNVFPAKKMFVTTTLIVIVFTTALQGSTIKWLVEMLQVKRSKHFGKEPLKQQVIEYFFNETNKCLVHFLEDLTSIHRQNYLYRKFLEIDERMIKPWLVANYKYREADIVQHHQKLQIDEFSCNLRGAGGSFAGLPTVSSLNNLVHHPGLPKSKSEAVLIPRLHDSSPEADAFSPEPTERSNLLPVPPPSERSIPRNESLSCFVREAFESAAASKGRGSLRDKRRSLYSRHLMDMDFGAPDDEESAPAAAEEYDNSMTYPACRSASAKFGKQFRNYGRSMKERGPLSPPAAPRGTPGRGSISAMRASTPRETCAPMSMPGRPRLSLPTPDEIHLKRNPPKISFSTQDETIPAGDAPSSARQSRKISIGRKTFIVGGDERDMPAIREEPSFLDPQTAVKRDRTYSSNN